MSSDGPVRHDPPESDPDVHRAQSRAVERLSRLVAEMAEALRALQKTMERPEEPCGRGEAALSRSAGSVWVTIEGRRLRLTPTLKMVLVALAGGRNARRDGGGQSIEEIRDCVEAAKKKSVTRRAIIQAVYRLKREFALAGLRDGLIATDRAGRWKLEISPISLAGLRESRSDTG
jgi:hypothetical protein